MTQSSGVEAGLTRRAFLGGAGALAVAGCAGVRGRKLEELDPRVAVFLASEDAVFITGELIHANGGAYLA